MHTDAVGLHHQHAVVPVAHQSGHKVSLGMHQPEHNGLLRIEETHPLTVGNCALQPLSVKRLVHMLCVERQHFAYYRIGLVMTHGQPPPVGGNHIHQVAFLRIALHTSHRTREQPWVATHHGLVFARGKM